MKTFIAVLTIVTATSLAQEANEAETQCLSRPGLTCFLIPTLSETLEGEQSQVRGGMRLTPFWRDNGCYTRVTGTVIGLGDSTPHGIHVHEFGDISSPDGTSTGGHYNPFGNDDPLPGEGSRSEFHVGDLGNIFPNDEGRADFDVFYADPISTWALIGRSVVIHVAEDGGREAQPTGDAGSRLSACVLGTLSA